MFKHPSHRHLNVQYWKDETQHQTLKYVGLTSALVLLVAKAARFEPFSEKPIDTS
jgi:hypothetical protein